MRWMANGIVGLMVLLAAAPTALADEVRMQDGSVLRGDVVDLRDGRLRLATSFAGELLIAQEQIAGIDTDGPVAVSLVTGERVKGRLSAAAGSQVIQGTTFGDLSIEVSSIRAITGVDDPPPVVEAVREEQQAALEAQAREHEAKLAEVQERLEAVDPVWSGRLELGLTGKTGNTERTNFSGRVSVKRETKKDRLFLYAQGEWAQENGDRTDNEIIGGARLEFDATDRLFWFLKGELEFDEFENLDLRSTVSLGLGYFFWKEPELELKGRFGAGYEHESFTDGSTADEFVLELGYDLRADLNESLRFTQSVTYYPSITESPTEEYRIRAETALELPIGTGEPWRIRAGLRNEYDNSPRPGVDRLDTTYFMNLTYDW